MYTCRVLDNCYRVLSSFTNTTSTLYFESTNCQKFPVIFTSLINGSISVELKMALAETLKDRHPVFEESEVSG